jgi:MazG family protein
MNTERMAEAVKCLIDLVARLRGPGGCPWDAKQTDATIKIYLIEEAYEVLDAIESSSPDELCSELGDLFFQILFLCQLSAERGDFDFVRVVEKITEKMVRRHPHVFGNASVENAEEVAENWNRIKREENGHPELFTSQLMSVPGNLPALSRAHRLSERASKAGFDWKSIEAVWEKVEEEFHELQAAISSGDSNGVSEELGDLLFSLVNLARLRDTNAEDLLRMANRKFLFRFERMEKLLNSKGIGMKKATAEQMDLVWEEVKTFEKEKG